MSGNLRSQVRDRHLSLEAVSPGVLDPAGGTMGAEPRHRWNQCERHSAVAQKILGSLNGLHGILDCEGAELGKSCFQLVTIVGGEVS